MKMLTAVALVTLIGAGASSASAQGVTLDFKDGNVTLKAQGVSVSQILSEWARRGRTTIVNGERVPGPALTIELQDMPEQQALDIVLRGASGYLVAARETAIAGASSFDRVYILATSARPTNATSLPQAQQPLQQSFEGPDDDDPPQRGPNQPPGARLPRDVAPNRPAVVDVEESGPEPENRPAPANPFGVTPGTSRPGVISPGQTPPGQPRNQ